MPITLPGAGPRIDVDLPLPGAVVRDAIEIEGWAFSRRAPIARVEAVRDGGAPVELAYGLPRPDVASLHGCDAACGFAGRLLVDGAPEGPVDVALVAVDARGRRASRRVTVVRGAGPQPANPVIEIDGVQWRGDELEIAGYALAPAGTSWRAIELRVDGACAGIASHGLSRPELHGRFPAHADPRRSGYRFRGPIEGPGAITLHAFAMDGTSVARAIPRHASAADGVALGPLPALLRRLRDELGRDPFVLDGGGLGVAAAVPHELVVTPLDPARLPYADATFDVVVVRAADPRSLAEARRLASRAIVEADAAGELRIAWQAPAPSAQRASVSVVIPVFNQSACTDACLAAVVATWPEGTAGEVIVVDDGSTDDTRDVVARWTARASRIRLLSQAENAGFVAACNAGAAAAASDVLVFLNNDTLPRPGWLPPLLAALERPDAGAVGGKLLFPDGSLQEAGGVVFSDGDGCNFGKFDREPDDPLFDHVREVDYCSGALLATPRSLFASLGGFDMAFAPAYYEDADYAFRLRAAGRRVYYEPASVVVHLEGATAGRDLGRGVKQHQVKNRASFVARWGDALAGQPDHPDPIDRAALHRLRVRGRRSRRALVLLPTMPEPDREGGSRRAFHQIEMLVGAGWAVSVVVDNATGGERYARSLRRLGAAVYAGAVSRGAGADYLPELEPLLRLEAFDLALVAFWHLAERHLPALRAVSPHTRVLVDSVDLHFLRASRGAFAEARAGARLAALDERYADEMRRELNVYGAADGVLAVSAKEAGWIDDLVGVPGHAMCVPLLEDPPDAAPLEGRRGLLFLANFRHPPNVDALGFLEDVVARLDPALLAEQRLAVVGNALEAGLLGALAGHPSIDAVGWVPRVEPYLRRARVSLVPLRQGAGTKAKLLQSLAAGAPCVSTPVGTEGLELTHERELLVAETPDAFAAAVTRLVQDDAECRRLCAAGREAVERAHGPEVVRALWDDALARTLSRRSRA